MVDVEEKLATTIPEEDLGDLFALTVLRQGSVVFKLTAVLLPQSLSS